MRELHVLGVSDDGTAVLFGSSDDTSQPTYRVMITDRLRAAVRGELGSQARAESALPPREIQARLRAGDTPEEVADAAGIPLTRVAAYAAPVIAERERVVEQARAAIMHRAQKPLGELVDARLTETPGFHEDSVEWTVRRRPDDGAWEVELAYHARGGRRTAAWLWRPAERVLTPLDAAGSRFGGDPPAEQPAARRGRSSSRRTKSRDVPDRSTAQAPATRTPTPERTVAAPGTPPPVRPDRLAAGERPTPPVEPPTPPVEPPTPQGERPVTAGSATPDEPSASAQRSAQPTPTGDEPAADTTPPPEERRAAARRHRRRVPLPSWDDVLLGVQSSPRDGAARRDPPPASHGGNG